MTPTPALPMWLEVLKAVAPLIAALLAAGVGAWVAHKFGTIQAGIARQQAETAKAAAATAKNKLKLDLLEKRMEVYRAARDAISLLIRSEFTTEQDMAYQSAADRALWLFGEEVNDYLNGVLWPLICKVRLAQNSLKEAVNEEENETAEQELRELKHEASAHRYRINEIFAPYLKLES